MMLAFAMILHNAKNDNKGDGVDISNMLRTFKSFDDASSGGTGFHIDTSRYSRLVDCQL